MYPFPEIEEELASLMGYPYKCFLWNPKENSQIRMAEDDEEKTGFHTEEGVYCFTRMSKGLKNSTATLQRMVEKVLADQKGWNVEVYLEEIVMKSKEEQSLIEDVSGLYHNRRWNKARPNKNTSGNEKPHTKRLRSDTEHVRTTSKHRQVYTKISGTHASHPKSLPKLRYGRRTKLDERGRRSLTEDKKKVAKIANTNHAKEGEVLILCLQQKSETINSMLKGVQMPSLMSVGRCKT
ncbi:reverse transcriptase domain-containing protein [Tanacetum coccineum]